MFVNTVAQRCVSRTSFNVTVRANVKMTSVDSGVETGNDSNDSSIVQHENLMSGQISNTSSTAVATAACTQIEDETNPFRIEFGPLLPVGFTLPFPPLCPAIKNYYNYTDDHRNSSVSGVGPVECSSKVLEFRFPHMWDSRTMELFERRHTCHRKMKFYPSHRNHHYLTWNDVQGLCIGRKMRLAAATNNTIMMSRLLSSGASPNNFDGQGRTPLHLASCRGYTEMVRLLLEHGADPNMRDSLGNTPLHLAAVTNKISVVTLLLKAGTDVLSLDQHGYNPLQLAQAKLRMLQNCKGEHMQKVKEEVYNIISMLLVYLQKQKDAHEKVETLSTFCSRLSLSNTSDQVQDDVKDLLDNLDALSITS